MPPTDPKGGEKKKQEDENETNEKSCPRPDCLSILKELKLLKGELEDFDAENEQLHVTVAAKEEQIKQLKNEVAKNASQKKGKQNTNGEMDKIQAEVVDLQQENHRLKSTISKTQRELAEATKSNAAQMKQLQTVQEQLEEKNILLNKQIQAQQQLELKQTGNSDERDKAKQNREEIYRLLKENETAAEENRELREGLAKVSQVAIEYEKQIEQLQTQMKDLNQVITENLIEKTQFETRVRQMEEHKRELEEKNAELEESAHAVDQLIHQQQEKFQKEINSLKAEVESFKSKEVKDTPATGEDENVKTVKDLHGQISKLEELRKQDRTIIIDLKDQNHQQDLDIQSLVDHIKELKESESKSTNSNIEASYTSQIKNLEEKLKMKDSVLADRLLCVKETEERYASLEKDVVFFKLWKEKYEQGAGLEEVASHQNKLRSDLKRQENDNQKLIEKLNAALQNTEILNFSIQKLKQNFKISDDEFNEKFGINSDSLRLELRGENASLQSMVVELEKQIEKLEEERIQLLSSLKETARRVGLTNFQQIGLNPDQIPLLNEYITYLKQNPTIVSFSSVAASFHKNTDASNNISSLADVQNNEDEIKKLGMELNSANAKVDVLQKQVDKYHENMLKINSENRQKIHDSEKERAKEDSVLLQEKNDAIIKARQCEATIESLREQLRHVNKELAEKTNELQACKDDLAAQTHVQKSDKSELDGNNKLHLEHDIDRIASTTAAAVTKVISDNIKSHDEGKGKTESIEADHEVIFESNEKDLLNCLELEQKIEFCVEELASKDTLIEELSNSLTTYEMNFSTIQDQYSILYQQYIHQYESMQAKINAMSKSLEEFKSENEDKQFQIQKLNNVLDLHQSPDTDMDKGGVERKNLLRQLAIFEVNEYKLCRKYNLLLEEYELLQKTYSNYENEADERISFQQKRISYLEVWKRGAETTIVQMENYLNSSIAKADYALVHQELTETKANYEILLKQSISLRLDYQETKELPYLVSNLMFQLEVLQNEKNLNTNSTGLKGKEGNLSGNIIDSAEKKRREELEKEVQNLLVRCSEFENRCFHAENVAREAKEKAQSIVNTYYQGMTREQTQVAMDRIHELEGICDGLLRDAEKYKNLLDLAVEQNNALNSKQDRMLQNNKFNQDRLRELQSRSDEEAIIGKLQLQLNHMKIDYQNFARKYDINLTLLRSNQMKYHDLLVKYEQKEKKVQEMSQNHRERVQIFEKTIWKMERDMINLQSKSSFDNTSMAQNPLEYLENISKRVDCLIDSHEEKKKHYMKTEDNLLAKTRELEQIKKSLVYLSNSKNSHLSEHKRQIIQSILSSNQEEKSKDKIRLLNNRVAQQMKESTNLEKQNQHLLQQIQEIKLLCTCGNDKGVRHSNRTDQEQQTRKNNNKLLEELEKCNKRILSLLKEVETAKQYKHKCEQMQQELALSKEQYSLLLASIDSNSKAIDNSINSGSPIKRKVLKYYEEDQEEIQRAAQVTIASLKSLLEEKNKSIQDYQQRIQHIENSYSKHKQQDQEEIEHLNEKIFQENNENIDQLKQAYEKIISTSENLDSIDHNQLKIQENLIEQLEEKESMISKLRDDIEDLEFDVKKKNNQVELAETRAGELLVELDELKKKRKEKEKRNDEKNKKIQEMVLILKTNLSSKESKIAGLREAVIKLKEEFIKAESRHAHSLAKEETKVVTIESDKVANLEEEVHRLEKTALFLQEKNQETAKDLLKYKKRNEKSKAQYKKLQELQDQVAQLEQERDDLYSQNSNMEQKKSNNQDVNSGDAVLVEDLRRKLKILQAQNIALRENSAVNNNSKNNAPEELRNLQTEKAARKLWEQEKRFKKRIEMLTSRLDQKKLELESTQNQLKHTREMLVKVEEERDSALLLVQEKNNRISRIEKKNFSAESQNLQAEKIGELKGEIEKLHQQREVEIESHRRQYFATIESYKKRIAELTKPVTNTNKKRNDKGSETYLNEIYDLERKNEAIQTSLLEKENKVLELQFDIENYQLENQRLKRLTRASAVDNLDARRNNSHLTRENEQRNKSNGNKGSREKELEKVIENMKKVIEKLRSEKDRLKQVQGTTVSMTKFKEVRGKCRELQGQVNDLNLSLAKQMQVQMPSKNEEILEKKLQTMKNQNIQKILKFEAKIQQLLEENEQLHEQNRGGSNSSNNLELIRDYELKNQELQKQVDNLTKELSAFDFDFFEEIEDLKYKYAKAVKENRKIRQHLKVDLDSSAASSSFSSS